MIETIDDMSKTIDELVKLSDNKKLVIEYETYGSCCIAVPNYIVSILKNGEKISSKALEVENSLEYLLKKAKN